jgi:hypothetical protein
MVLLFFLLLGLSVTIGDRKTRKIVSWIEVPVNILSLSTNSPSSQFQGGFALRYINVLFCPAFVLIPLSPSVSGREVGKIVAVFSACLFQLKC